MFTFFQLWNPLTMVGHELKNQNTIPKNGLLACLSLTWYQNILNSLSLVLRLYRLPNPIQFLSAPSDYLAGIFFLLLFPVCSLRPELHKCYFYPRGFCPRGKLTYCCWKLLKKGKLKLCNFPQSPGEARDYSALAFWLAGPLQCSI